MFKCLYVCMTTLIIFFAKYLIFIFVAPLTFFWMKGSRVLFWRALLGSILAYSLALFTGFIFPVPRPFEKAGDFPPPPVFFFEQHPQFRTASFPSKHMAVAVLISLVLMSRNRRWGAIFLALAFLVGWGRVSAQVHTWWDIAGGAAIGGLCAVLVERILL